MSVERAEVFARASNLDPRDELRKRDRYVMRPDSLQEWFVEKRLGCAAEWIYWHLWNVACMSGNWVVAVPISTLATKFHLNETTVIRAIRTLIQAGALRRTRRAKGEDRFREPVALTEVLLPIDVCKKLPAIRQRGSRPKPTLVVSQPGKRQPDEASTGSSQKGEGAADALPPKLGIPSFLIRLKAHSKLSDEEEQAWLAWKAGKAERFEFAPTSRLTREERERVLNAQPLVLSAAPKPEQPRGAGIPQAPRRSLAPRVIDTFTAERLRRRLNELVPKGQLEQYFQEATWSLEHASFAKYDSLLRAINVIMKLIREKRWRQPMGMPSNWRFVPREVRVQR
jgi:hypothetical protein